MFGHRWFGGRFWGPRYFGDGGVLAPPEEPPSVIVLQGARHRGSLLGERQRLALTGTAER